MHRFASFAAVALVVLAFAAPAAAFQCPKLVKQINDATGTRFDAAAADARAAAVQANALHTAGKHAEAEKAAKDALAKIGMKQS